MNIKEFILYFIPDKYRHDEEVFRKVRLFVTTCFITSLFSAFYFLTSYLAGMPHVLWAMAFNVIGFILLPFLLKRDFLPLKVLTNAYILIGTIGVVITVFYTGGLISTSLCWLAVLPIASLMLINKRSGWIWTIVTYLTISFIGALTLNGFQFADETNKSILIIFNTSNLNGLGVLIFLIALVFENTKNTALQNLDEKNKQLDKEKQRSDELLLNILPAEVMEELKSTGKTRARHYDMVSVIFADFKDFTKVSEKLSPQELVSTIDQYYEIFDNLVGRFGAEKIKTVGDAYICAVGIPLETKDNAIRAVQLSQEILNEVNKLKTASEGNTNVAFDIRIGIHTGPLVAGVVGIKKFAYDIWGDTVNTAARMQESGDTNKINISNTTYELVKDDIKCSYRGKVAAKNKGDIDMYFVE